MNYEKYFFGNYQAKKNDTGYHILIEDNSNKNDSDFWLSITVSGGGLVGHLHFTKIGPELYGLDRMRPTFCPIHNLSDICTPTLCPRREET